MDGNGSIDRLIATGDKTAISLLEKFLDAALEHYPTGVAGIEESMKDVMPALYALNRYLLATYPEMFPSGFFVGNETEVHHHVRQLISSSLLQRKVSVGSQTGGASARPTV